MIPGWLVILLSVFGWISFVLYMWTGRDVYGHPLWFWIGLPAPFIVLLVVGHFYYGYPLFDWTTEPALPVRVVGNE
jgi:O-antigen/teichoic acid export membrane protein